ncbi:NAD(P)-binding protein [Aspergillus steynii IBT 23096]|uniref:NAD(P)-binding protein n=1 Tax=Aspergillus steynii IBT 23096 TaxID=1392250 RepID=A0A2I2GB39_9EURO|nr:NAD(P)-binding protein [Aspergillus steynii IBT 23096]PLB50103.1 NAD(P)-binding protein [Aspergillus steynii IBT 23096]
MPHRPPRVWLLTGCSSGFGKLMVPAITARGDAVVATARNIATLADLADQDNVRLLQLDVTASQDVLDETIATAIALFGQIDVLVHNAGYVLSGVWEEVSHSQVLEQFNTNFFGPMNLTRALLPHLRTRRTGTIIFMSSIAGWLGVAAGGPYSASKFALEGAIESLHKETTPLGITTHLIVLGQFRTDILAAGRREVARCVDPVPEYDSLVGALASRQEETHGKQPGDPVVAVERILDVVRREGRFFGTGEVPLRVVLGSDALGIVRGQCLEMLGELDAMEEVVRSTDFEGAKEVQEYK